MTAINIGRIALQARIALTRAGVIPVALALTLLLGATPWISLALNARDGGQQHALAQAQQEQRAALPAAVAVRDAAPEQNMRKFYDALGDKSEAEQHLKTVFAIAAQTGLHLDQGEYQWQLDKNSSTYRYQILLPVKGSYGAIRRFCEQTLLALPFASLDELSFKRESAGEDALDANLRFTLYLADKAR